MKTIIALALLVAAALASPHPEWAQFKATHNKSYSNAVEEVRRLAIFKSNVAKMEAHNALYEKGEVTYTMGVNQFSDWTSEEFLEYVNRGKLTRPQKDESLKIDYVPSKTPAAASVDWRGKAVTEVKNQGQCGSCWSFATTGAVEGQLAVSGKKLVSLSEQNLIDCSASYGNAGCDGGWMGSAFNYIHDHGIESEAAYPYKASQGSCKFEQSKSVTSVRGYTDLPSGSESSLADAVSKHGPIAVAIDATDALQHYSSGILHDKTCNAKDLNHGVLVVGYGSESGTDYWIVKNSWGASWGEKGFYRAARNSNNNCGIATAAEYPALLRSKKTIGDVPTHQQKNYQKFTNTMETIYKSAVRQNRRFYKKRRFISTWRVKSNAYHWNFKENKNLKTKSREFTASQLSCKPHQFSAQLATEFEEERTRNRSTQSLRTMKFLIVVAMCLVGSQAVSFFDLVQEQWTTFKMTHKKEYQSETEERFRMKIFMENAHKVEKHNKLYAQGLVKYKLGINKYADMLHHEFVQTLNGFNRSKTLLRGQDLEDSVTFISPANVEMPKQVDWRKQGAVTPVKDQGQCGSCWSFSATGALEGQHYRKTKKLVSLSEQNLVDCSEKFGNNGCNGGLMDNAFRYIKANGGIDTEASYPYKAEDEKCHYRPKNKGATDRGFVDIDSGNEDKLKAAVATVGPISVAIDASHQSFQLYAGGVYYEEECSPDQLDHGVLVVGYGTDDDENDFWIVKNSWGPSWGDQGYIKMARNRDNNCGIATQASYPLV